MKKSIFILGLIMLMCTASVAQASVTNLIQNGDFESTTGSGYNKFLNNWDGQALVLTSSTSSQSRVTAPNLINTTTFVSLDKYTGGPGFFPDEKPMNLTIYQSVNLVQGQTYAFAFDYLNQPGSASGGVNLSVDEFTFSTSSRATKWSTYTGEFTYSGPTGSTIFSLSGIGKNDAQGGFIDNVSLVQKPATTPIPAAVWLLGTGLAGLVGFRKKFKA